MSNIDSFFNKSKFNITSRSADLDIDTDVAFTATFDITEIIGRDTAASVTSRVLSKDGRTTTVISSSPTWLAPVTRNVIEDLETNTSDITFQLVACDKYGTQTIAPSVVIVDTLSYTYCKIIAIDLDREPLAVQPAGTVAITTTDNGTTIPGSYILSTLTPTVNEVFSLQAQAAGDTVDISITGSYSEIGSQTVTYAPDEIVVTIRDVELPIGLSIWILTDTITFTETQVLLLEITMVDTYGISHVSTVELYGGV